MKKLGTLISAPNRSAQQDPGKLHRTTTKKIKKNTAQNIPEYMPTANVRMLSYEREVRRAVLKSQTEKWARPAL